ncbi:MAG: hypothetical protein HY578_04650 [Nitrospinae bacterium]|nr:hypothetical protein [Nitrospinota bacterium]
MKYLSRLFLFMLLIAYIIGIRPVNACIFCENSTLNYFYQDLSYKSQTSIQIYCNISNKNKEGLMIFNSLIYTLDKLLKEEGILIGFIKGYSYRKYIDVDIIGEDNCYIVYIKKNNDLYKKKYFYEEKTKEVALDIIVKMLAEEI